MLTSSAFCMLFFFLKQSLSSIDRSPLAFQVERQRLSLEKGQPSNLVSISSGNIENWEESAMADASPRTDISTDVDTDDKNQRVMFLSPHLSICYFLHVLFFPSQ